MSLRSGLWAAVGVLVLAVSPAGAASIGELIGERVENLRGETVGHVDELIVDINAGRVLYVIVDRKQGYATLPIGAIERVLPREHVRLDMSLSSSPADLRAGADPRFRRAGKLIGQEVEIPRAGRLGVIHDLEFEPDTGLVTRVDVGTVDGTRGFPASVLSRGRFSPATRWHSEK